MLEYTSRKTLGKLYPLSTLRTKYTASLEPIFSAPAEY